MTTNDPKPLKKNNINDIVPCHCTRSKFKKRCCSHYFSRHFFLIKQETLLWSQYLFFYIFHFLRHRYHSCTIFVYDSIENMFFTALISKAQDSVWKSAQITFRCDIVVIYSLWYITPFPNTGTWQWRSCIYCVQFCFQSQLKIGGAGVHERILHAVHKEVKSELKSLVQLVLTQLSFHQAETKVHHEKNRYMNLQEGTYEEFCHLSPAEKSSHHLPVTLSVTPVSCGRCSEYPDEQNWLTNRKRTI